MDTLDDLAGAAEIGVGASTAQWLYSRSRASAACLSAMVHDEAVSADGPENPTATGTVDSPTAEADSADPGPGAPPAATAHPDESADLPADRYPQPRIVVVGLQQPCPGAGRGHLAATARTRQFLAIFTSNLDEFFMVRVAGLKRRDETGLSVRSADGLSPREQLNRIAQRTQSIATRQARVFNESVKPALDDEGIHIVTWADLDEVQRERLVTALLRRAGLPGPHAARRRPCPPVPLHKRVEPEPGRHRPRQC